MKAYSDDLRARVVKAVKSGKSIREVAEQFQISESTVKRYLKLERDTGSVARGNHRYHSRLLQKHFALLESLLDQAPDQALRPLSTALEKITRERISHTTIWRAVKELKSIRQRQVQNVRSKSNKTPKRHTAQRTRKMLGKADHVAADGD